MGLKLSKPGETRIGWIGTGVMGLHMCGHLIDKGFSATVYNRTREKCDTLISKGAVWADTPRAVAEASDTVFTIVGFPRDVREVILGDHGVLTGCDEGNIIVDMTTSEPSLAEEIAEKAETMGVASVDAPVSGGDLGARNGALSIMVGGGADAVASVMPCFEIMGKTIVRQGGPGAGQHTKMVNQALIASNMVSVCEGLLYAYKAGLDLPTVLQSVGSGAAASWALNNLGPRIIDNDFDPGFFVEHFIKDMGIILSESRRMGISVPGVALSHQLYVALQSQGHGRDGTQALELALARMSGIDWQNR